VNGVYYGHDRLDHPHFTKVGTHRPPTQRTSRRSRPFACGRRERIHHRMVEGHS
jgi:hypothetical protein